MRRSRTIGTKRHRRAQRFSHRKYKRFHDYIISEARRMAFGLIVDTLLYGKGAALIKWPLN